jgi:hypothetical protein
MSSMTPTPDKDPLGVGFRAEQLPISQSAILQHLHRRKFSLMTSIRQLNERQRAFVFKHVEERRGHLVDVERGPAKTTTTEFGKVTSMPLFWIIDRTDIQDSPPEAPKPPASDSVFMIFIKTRALCLLLFKQKSVLVILTSA